VIFDTIYPGWYRGRAPHIHLKVHVGGTVVHTGQLFFADPISDAVYRTAHYKSHGQPDTTDAKDSIYKQAGGSSALLKLTTRAGSSGYLGAMTLGVKA
jgi:protocatechuate 3,4-dioxygenase beta subunit